MKDMKKFFNQVLPIVAIAASAFSVLTVTSTTTTANASGAQPQSKTEMVAPQPQPTEVRALPVQPVDLTGAAERALPAVVHIKYVQNSKVQTVEVQSDPFEDFFSDPFGGFFGRGQQGQGGTRKRQIQTPKRTATGSGVIISADGYIVTNNHVVEGADELTVTLSDSKEYSARIIGNDKTTDLALIKIDGRTCPPYR